ncbi:MAG: hypothetical protein IJH64_00515 [Oscillospiraceae bacterium]|nr:hypothetical protein [Oscillospiraceae bacterium]
MYTKDDLPKSLLDFKQIKAINQILTAGNRVELIPVKDGVKVIEVKRQEVK